jgi:hypothetical protein
MTFLKLKQSCKRGLKLPQKMTFYSGGEIRELLANWSTHIKSRMITKKKKERHAL